VPSSIDFEQYKKKPKAVYITYNVIAFSDWKSTTVYRILSPREPSIPIWMTAW